MDAEVVRYKQGTVHDMEDMRTAMNGMTAALLELNGMTAGAPVTDTDLFNSWTRRAHREDLRPSPAAGAAATRTGAITGNIAAAGAAATRTGAAAGAAATRTGAITEDIAQDMVVWQKFSKMDFLVLR